MAAAQSVPSEVEKSEQEDLVKEVICWVVKALLQEEERPSYPTCSSIVPQQFGSSPVETPLGAGRASGRHDEIWG